MLHSEKGRQPAARVPRDRILTETDGPLPSKAKGRLGQRTFEQRWMVSRDRRAV